MAVVFKKNLSDFSFFHAGDGTVLKEILHPEKHSLDTGYSIAYAYLPPGESSLPHILSASEVYLFLSGSGVFHIDGKEMEIESGDIILVPAKTVQYVHNTGKENLIFYCIVEPPWEDGLEEVTQKE